MLAYVSRSNAMPYAFLCKYHIGAFECYIVADASDTAEAAEVYRSDNQEEEESLLSVSPGNNILSLVMRDQQVMRFVKYVSASAPGSRWDIAVEYELKGDLSNDDDEDDDDNDDDDDDDDDDEGGF
jgi:prolyl 3-hydroxylase /prolyl 3,4-dihydroxylase